MSKKNRSSKAPRSSSKAAAKKAPTKKSAAKVESDAAKAARLGPVKKIVKWVPNPNKKATTKIAVLECGHGRALPEGPRQTFRCNQCRIEKKAGTKILSRFQKALAARGGKLPKSARTPAAKAPAKKKAVAKKRSVPRKPLAARPPREAVTEAPVAVQDVAASA